MIGFQSLLKLIEDAHIHELPFVAYRKPNKSKVKAIIQRDDRLVFADDYTTSGFIFAPFDADEKSIIFPLENAAVYETQLEEVAFPLDGNGYETTSIKDKDSHIDLVKKGVDFIKKGAAKKIVLSRKEELNVPDFSLLETFDRLLQTYKNAFVYVWYHPKVGLWLGATPERLISIKDTSFKTVSLAGTQPYINTLDVTWGAKELEEQQLVTDYIQSNLEAVADEVVVSKLNTVKAGNLLHLCTNISGNLRNQNNLYSLVSQLHPTPATCGLSKDVAKQFILENEQYNREFYTGFLGELNMNNKTNLYVNLRCMKVDTAIVSLFLGGGITKDSIAENEWQETVEKSKVMKKVLPN